MEFKTKLHSEVSEFVFSIERHNICADQSNFEKLDLKKIVSMCCAWCWKNLKIKKKIILNHGNEKKNFSSWKKSLRGQTVFFANFKSIPQKVRSI